MWIVAVVWQVIELGGSPIDLSVIATGSAVGAVAAVLVGGVVADWVTGRRIMIAIEITKVVSIAVTASLTLTASLALTGTVQIWHLAVVSFFYSVQRRDSSIRPTPPCFPRSCRPTSCSRRMAWRVYCGRW